MKDYMVYLINWEKINHSVLEIEKNLIENEISFTVVNSSSKNVEGWLNLGSDAWATRQVYEIYKNAVENKYEKIFLLYGDVSTEGISISEVIESSLKTIINLPDFGIYTKKMKCNDWGSLNTIIGNYNDQIDYICATDFSFVGLDKKVFTFAKNFIDLFSSVFNIDDYKSGWGFDYLCWIYCLYNKINMYRDNEITLLHEISETGYNKEIAHQQMNEVLNFGCIYLSEIENQNIDVFKELRLKLSIQYGNKKFNYKDFYE
jgi:hypothetical protein